MNRGGKAGRPRGKASVTGAAKATRAKTALELRIEGLSVEQIARRLGVAQSTVSLDLSHALGDLAEANKGKSAEFVELEVARCDEVIRALWTRRKDHRCAEKILKAIDRKAKLLGLDAPKKLEMQGELNCRPPVMFIPEPEDEPGSTPATDGFDSPPARTAAE